MYEKRPEYFSKSLSLCGQLRVRKFNRGHTGDIFNIDVNFWVHDDQQQNSFGGHYRVFWENVFWDVPHPKKHKGDEKKRITFLLSAKKMSLLIFSEMKLRDLL